MYGVQNLDMFFNFKNKMDSTWTPLLYMTINQKQLNWILQDKTIDVSFFEGEGHWQRGVKGLTLLRKTSISRLWARHYSLINGEEDIDIAIYREIYRERYTPLGGIKGKAKQPAKWCVKEGRWLHDFSLLNKKFICNWSLICLHCNTPYFHCLHFEMAQI